MSAERRGQGDDKKIEREREGQALTCSAIQTTKRFTHGLLCVKAPQHKVILWMAYLKSKRARNCPHKNNTVNKFPDECQIVILRSTIKKYIQVFPNRRCILGGATRSISK
jgi:hypothetical protein